MVVAVAIVPGDTLLSTPSPLPSQSSAQAPKIPPHQLDSLVAPIALYPDPVPRQNSVRLCFQQYTRLPFTGDLR